MTVAINGLSAISDKFDAFFIDQYGVVHDGVRPYFGASYAMRAIFESKKPLLMISNSGRSEAYNKHLLDALGIPSALFLSVLTSGDSARLVMGRLRTKKGVGVRCYPILNDNQTEFLESMGFVLTNDPYKTDVVFLAGIDSRGNDVDTFEDELSGFLSSGAVMVCANPDARCLVRGELKFGPGRLAEIYQQMGGEVQMIGKPHAPIFEIAIDSLPKDIDRSRILMVGDSFTNDIVGANQVGLCTLLIGCGIHKVELGLGGVNVNAAPPALETMNLEETTLKLADELQMPRPDYVSPLFMW